MINKTPLETIADTLPVKTGQIILLQGPPGCGKTPIARRLGTRIGGTFRAPHHTVSKYGLIGELALAAGGVLFLNEWTEFNRTTFANLWWHWRAMDSRVRPTVVLGWEPRLERTAFDDPQRHWKHVTRLTVQMPPIDRHLVLGKMAT